MRGTWIAIAAVVVGLALVGGLALVRGGDETGVALADAAERIEGESMLMRFTMGMSDKSGDYSVRGEGPWTADSSRGIAEMTITFGDEPPIDMTLRNVGRDYWFRSKQLNGILPPGKRWVHSYDRAGPATTLTPSQFASFLADADDVEEIGAARVLDQAATHYRGVLDLEELADEIGGETGKQLEAALEREDIPEGSKPGMPIEAWLAEDDGLPVRMRIWSGDAKASMDMTIDILEYGVSVEVEPPPENTVIEESEFDRLTGS
jgi:hypothetical protein